VRTDLIAAAQLCEAFAWLVAEALVLDLQSHRVGCLRSHSHATYLTAGAPDLAGRDCSRGEAILVAIVLVETLPSLQSVCVVQCAAEGMATAAVVPM